MDDFFVDEAKVIETDQIAEVPLVQIMLDIQRLRAIVGELLKSVLELAAVLPTLEEY